MNRMRDVVKSDTPTRSSFEGDIEAEGEARGKVGTRKNAARAIGMVTMVTNQKIQCQLAS